MSESPEYDLEAAHRRFSVSCSNKAWDLLEKPEQTADEDEAMIRLSLASIGHWTQRPDCTRTTLSIGSSQTARIYALLGQMTTIT